MPAITCPECGESKLIDVIAVGPFRLEVTCNRTLVHGEPRTNVIDDPNTPESPAPGDPKVLALKLYDKLEQIIFDIGRPAEHGVVEYLLWETHPDAYHELWTWKGHRTTHPGQKNSLSQYLGSILSLLDGYGRVDKGYTASTGELWEHLTDVGAWTHPSVGGGDLLTWEAFASERGIEGWPPTASYPVQQDPREADA